METTTLLLKPGQDARAAERIRQVLDGEHGIARVLARPDRGAVYVRHSAAKMPRHRLVERLEGEDLHVRIREG